MPDRAELGVSWAWQRWGLTAVALVALSGAARAEDKPVYRCPGNLYTDTLSAKEAVAKGCKTLEGAPITVLQSPKRAEASAPRSSESKVTPADQRNRDSDARRILEAELRKEEEALAQLKKDFNNGEPERHGDEKNFEKYQSRVAEMKAAIARKEADVEALKRELSKLPPS